ncbi:aspartate/glutamate racemase family protein, partial [Mesorhizobium sp. M8A.F.Ca.ET.213.01.1.1]|uniref:aspartate/glutamate racemase family protein n=1 Tax=Mesorhizobium sp. M8A.F.Ca.ET.213.01.1.1 TaxID=2563970 RepID=UPI001FE0F61D
MQILVVNPNTPASMTETVAAAGRSVARVSTEIFAVTSSMGPVSIEGYYDEALAVPGLLVEIAAGERAGAQAAIIACFDDTGLDAARAMAAIPVIGICEAALSVAS